VRTIVVVGASPNWNRPSYFVMKYLQGKGYRLRLSLRFPQFLEVDLGAVPPSCRLNEDASKAPMFARLPEPPTSVGRSCRYAFGHGDRTPQPRFDRFHHVDWRPRPRVGLASLRHVDVTKSPPLFR
jgi:hypothetical protein